MFNYKGKKNQGYVVRWGKKLLIISLVFLSLLMTVVIPVRNVYASSPKQELRGVWITNIDSDVLFEKKRLKNAINKLHELNFNTVYPVVWNWGYTLYPSKVAKKVIGRSLDPDPGLQKRDILKEIVTEGHRKKMAVIPWFEFGFMAPSDADLVK
ncbi:MAG TPA: family 10 glycosylhydrolase, partial [Allocoleopsis sp.]